MPAPPQLTVHRAESFAARLRGLFARPALRDDEALYLAPCSSVHTCFMRYSIDVVFLDHAGRVLKVVAGLKPWRAAACWRAHAALELKAGCAVRYGLMPRGTRKTNAPPPGCRNAHEEEAP